MKCPVLSFEIRCQKDNATVTQLYTKSTTVYTKDSLNIYGVKLANVRTLQVRSSDSTIIKLHQNPMLNVLIKTPRVNRSRSS